MKPDLKQLGAAAVAVLALGSPAFAAAECGANTGEPATGEPIFVGGIHGNAAPGDWTSSTDSAAAYFACVNANGGIHGRPIEYLVENDQWNPEAAAQAAARLVNDTDTVAMVGNGSFIEMAVNAGTYEAADIMVMASACAISECFETPNLVSTNQGPLPSNLGAAQYAQEELGAEHIACMGLNIPNNGIWSCNAVAEFMESRGGQSTPVLINPGAPDVNSALLEALASGADTILINQPAGIALAILSAAEEQDLRDMFNWIAPTPLYDLSVPDQLGSYWHGHVFVNAELAPLNLEGPDALNWVAVLDEFGNEDDPRDTFGQAGYLSARFFVKAMLEMDPADVGDRAKVSEAIRGISGYTSDLMCGPYYVGDADFHMPNHAGYMVQIVEGGFEIVRDCYEYDSPYFERHIAIETELGLR
ncbi:ABC transporter substrate-binding protein [Ponticoccus sp. SC2-23]|uniref:ABC transporter substrate-binding protein n=1 Tax=Alexandriicola marinus TaxID=2081710 RepID=UPI000FD9805F|nr:ABC transporter substrate-binding protein [Alexandriicola marinus]MBM1219217.1 ABC transporter substrate-binding protein [Ponticoccus sp. SC6-9]MBM1223711.1 ABC transporter substrate-binding protein [Ponticoccus sp. SC6-15]MBM1229030.1 ABC transporter substrate-binding protein [Ponticoccus sp. SC6-38]MBM1232677.1 ABC transporter substrate-binding protein [Ponticoccus sp. SC6-45]MBM1237373.1 ABC transporter substrate-binding protein [Ponticoccus sp. SC6-49]MBM1241688.1 ABC transporter subst